ncbi:NF-kappa-B essential modulator [Drosophila tropicalis]|uniref:NF-kappa-B essential modulator n=1 Tax=Drosophila tropicalis TaxID=46794 RepID=UPI0035AC204E
MSEEESFVILGSSPLPSLCADGIGALHNDKEITESGEECKVAPRVEPASLTQLSISSIQPKSNENSLQTSLDKNVQTKETNGTGSAPKSLATSFILGEINSSVLKTSVYSQFPSLTSMEACAEDVVKLQNLITEHDALKKTLLKVNSTMENYYKISQERYKEAAARELRYQEQAQSLNEQIAQLRKENQQLKDEVASTRTAVQSIEEITQKETQELRQTLSEKISLIQNMRVEIEKLQQHHMPSYDFVEEIKIEEKSDAKKIQENSSSDESNKQALKIKELEREMSKLMAENIETLDMKKVYIDEINCLKVNLTCAEELVVKMQRDIQELKINDAQQQEQIVHLQTQNDIYRRDFEMERADREKNAGEKEQYLMDLRDLQRRNQKLIEDMAQMHKNNSPPVGLSSASSSSPSTSSGSSSRNSLRDNQRPVRVLDPTGAAAQTSSYSLRCPICSKSFTALSVLQSHVNDCLDQH